MSSNLQDQSPRSVMTVALIGQGQVGSLVEKMLIDQGHRCVQGLNAFADVCIDFSSAEAVKKTASEITIPWVIGTTGWKEEDIFPLIINQQIPCIYGANFSLGMVAFRRILKYGMHQLSGFYVQGQESHHKNKKDAPSGTALCLSKDLGGVSFTSIRKDDVIGIHEVLFSHGDEIITCRHTVTNREVFARGALKAAEWIVNQSAGIYPFESCVQPITNKEEKCFQE